MKHISKTTGEYVACTASQRGCPNKGHMSDGAFELLNQNPQLNKSMTKFNKKVVKNSKPKKTFKEVGIKWENNTKFPISSFVSKKISLRIP